MKEAELKKELVKRFKGKGLVWFPPKVKFYKQGDIFGAFDCLFYSGSGVMFIQMTTKTNISHRAKKVFNAFNDQKFLLPRYSFIYAWDYEKSNFMIVDIAAYLGGVKIIKYMD